MASPRCSRRTRASRASTLGDIQEFTAAEVEAAEILHADDRDERCGATRGYLLDTKNKAEAEKKEVADANLVKGGGPAARGHEPHAGSRSSPTEIGKLDATKLERD